MRKVFYTMKLGEDGIPFLAESKEVYHIDGRETYSTPSKIYELAKAIGSTDDAEESVYMACLDTRNRIIAVFLLTKGVLDASLIRPREAFQRALMAGAAGIIIWHNHPSGDTTPSSYDIKATERMVVAGNIIGIPLYDHIIVGREGDTLFSEGYTSLREERPELFSEEGSSLA